MPVIRNTPVEQRSRNREIAHLYEQGQTYQAIGDQFGLTRERVRQILKNLGISAHDGGHALRKERRAYEKAVARDELYKARWGHSYAAHQRLLAIGRGMRAEGYGPDKTPIGAYMRQREAASNRQIPWNLTLAAWWRIWTNSGHWHERGRGHGGYVMARFGDMGGYEVGNVAIVRSEVNSSERGNRTTRSIEFELWNQQSCWLPPEPNSTSLGSVGREIQGENASSATI